MNQASSNSTPPLPPTGAQPAGAELEFGDDFRRFFVRGLAALLPTLITLWLLVWVWNFLWDGIGQYIIQAIIIVWGRLAAWGVLPFTKTPTEMWQFFWGWSKGRGDGLPEFFVKLIGVGLAVLLIYIVGLFVGNLIGRTVWRIAERAVMRIPLVRAIYPAVKQVTDFVLAEKTAQFEQSRVVAVQPHSKGIWSIGLVTGGGLRPLSEAMGQEMVTVFIPSSPTAFSGYVVMVPRSAMVELPLKVEEAMRLLISGGVVVPTSTAGPGGAGELPEIVIGPHSGETDLHSGTLPGRQPASPVAKAS